MIIFRDNCWLKKVKAVKSTRPQSPTFFMTLA